MKAEKIIIAATCDAMRLSEIINETRARYPYAKIQLTGRRDRQGALKTQLENSEGYIAYDASELANPLSLSRYIGELRRGRFNIYILPVDTQRGAHFLPLKAFPILAGINRMAIYRPDGSISLFNIPQWLSFALKAELRPTYRNKFSTHFDAVSLLAYGGMALARKRNPKSAGGGFNNEPFEKSAGKRKIKIAYFITSIGVGGAQRQLIKLLSNLNRDIYDIQVIVLFKDDAFFAAQVENLGISITYLIEEGRVKGTRFAFEEDTPYTSACMALASILTEQKVEILHNWLFIANGIGAIAGGLADVPAVITSVRNMSSWKSMPGYKMWWYRPFDKIAARLSDAILANADRLVDDYAAWTGIPSYKVNAIHNCIVSSEYKLYGADEIKAARTELGIKDGQPSIISIGRLAIEKDYETLLKAVNIVRKTLPDVKSFIVGSGPEERKIRKLVRNLKLENNVTLLGTRRDVHRLLQSVDMLVLSSLIEGLPNVAMEAQLMGLPVVATDSGGSREVVIDGLTGRVTQVGQHKQIAEAVKFYLMNKSEAQKAGAEGRKNIIERFSIERMLNKTTDVYKYLFAEKVLPRRLEEN